MADKPSDIATRRDQPVTHRQTPLSPFRMLERFADEMDRMFDEVGFGRGWARPTSHAESLTWAPRIDVAQKDNQLVIRADLPGLSKDDVKVDVNEDGVVIQGERKREKEEERGGVYHRERSYGSFYRLIPLPPGAIADEAKASFKDGVLEITMPSPPEQVSRGRRLEISDSPPKSK